MRRLIAIALLSAAAANVGAAPRARGGMETESAQFNCDALNVASPLDRATARDLGPAHSLDAAAAVLARHNVKFERSQGQLSVSDAPKTVIQQIYQLPQGEPIVLPNGDGVTICVLRPSADSY
jgi:hypothetical protein